MVTGRFDSGVLSRCVNNFTYTAPGHGLTGIFTRNILLTHAQTTLIVIKLFV